MKTYSVTLFVEVDDNADDCCIEKVIEDCFDPYDGYVATSVSADLIDEIKENEL